MALRTTGTDRLLPPHLPDLLHRLSEGGRLFIELYEHDKDRMQAIAYELGGISIEADKMQKRTNSTRMMGAVLGGLGIVGVAAALLTGGSSAGEGAGKMAILGGTAAFCGGAAVIKASVTKAETEKISRNTVEELGGEFMNIVELQMFVLEEIKKVSEEIEEKSSSLMTTTGEQAKRCLSETKQLQQLLRQTADLAEKSSEATLTMRRRVRELLTFIISVIRIIPSEDDAKLRNCITDSALQCKKTVHVFAKMRNTLKDFEEMQTEQEYSTISQICISAAQFIGLTKHPFLALKGLKSD